MAKKSQYLQHLEGEIAKYEKLLHDAKLARDHYLRFSPPKDAKNEKTAKGLGRKGLRSKGRSRDLFEYFYKYPQGVNFSIAEVESGYSVKAIQQFLHRYKSFFDISNGRIQITAKGKDLVDASQPYVGSQQHGQYDFAGDLVEDDEEEDLIA